MVSQHNSNWNQSHSSRLDWFSWICDKNYKYFSSITSRICKCFIWQNSVFLRHPVSISHLVFIENWELTLIIAAFVMPIKNFCQRNRSEWNRLRPFLSSTSWHECCFEELLSPLDKLQIPDFKVQQLSLVWIATVQMVLNLELRSLLQNIKILIV